MQPEISIILPFYNSALTLERAVNSIMNQTFENFELILVNNNSDDTSSHIAHSLSKQDSRIILVNEMKRGVVYATEAGLRICKGKYICRMDADDEMFPEKLILQKDFLDTHPGIDIVAGRVNHVSSLEGDSGFERFVNWSNSILEERDIYLNRFIELPVVNPTIMWRRKISEDDDLYRQGSFPEDYELFLRWLEKGIRIAKIPEVVLKWYDSEKRLTRTDERYSEVAFSRIKSQYLSRWLMKNNPFHPYVSVWGASRISRKNVRFIEELGIRVEYYIDIKMSRQLNKPVIHYSKLPEPGSMFILTYVKQPDARKKTKDYLRNKGYTEGHDFLMIG